MNTESSYHRFRITQNDVLPSHLMYNHFKAIHWDQASGLHSPPAESWFTSMQEYTCSNIKDLHHKESKQNIEERYVL